MALVLAPHGTYVAPTAVLVQAGQDEVIAMLVAFMATMPTIVGGVISSESSAISPDFMEVTRHFKEKLQAEMDDIVTKIDAMPIV